MFKLVGFATGGTGSSANAMGPSAPISSGASLSALTQPFLAPLTIVTLSNFPTGGMPAIPAANCALNGTWQCVTGADLDLGATKAGEFTVKLRRYANSDQNTAMAIIPT